MLRFSTSDNRVTPNIAMFYRPGSETFKTLKM